MRESASASMTAQKSKAAAETINAARGLFITIFPLLIRLSGYPFFSIADYNAERRNLN
jgi:hypothetical protein